MAAMRAIGGKCRALMAAAKSSTVAAASSAKPTPVNRTPVAGKGILKPLPISPTLSHFIDGAPEASRTEAVPRLSSSSRFFSSSNVLDDSQAPAPIHYRSVLQEDEFHQLADSTIHHLLEKLEEYGDTVEIDGFDVDYGNEVLTLKLGDLGTYVVNKQTPNRQIWLSSPASGPSRYDWDPSSEAWVYRRTKASLFGLLESELEQLCGKSVTLSDS